MLSASLDYEQTLATVAQLVVRDVADWCVVEIGGRARATSAAEGGERGPCQGGALRGSRADAARSRSPLPHAVGG